MRSYLAVMVVALGSVPFVLADDPELASFDEKPKKSIFALKLPGFGKKETPKPAEPPPRPVSQETLNKQARIALLRRQAVCQRLREIAFETKDQELERKANQLDELAWRSYCQITGVGGVATFDNFMDRQSIENNLGLNGLSGQTALPGGANARGPAGPALSQEGSR